MMKVEARLEVISQNFSVNSKFVKKIMWFFFFVKFSGRSTRSGRRDSLSPDSAKEDGNFPQFFVKSLFREFNAIFLEYEKHLAYGNSRKTYFTYSTWNQFFWKISFTFHSVEKYYQMRSHLTELSCKNGIYQERGPKGPDF